MIEDEPLSKAMDEFKHYGVLGMKWGVRRPVGTDGLVKGTVKSAKRNVENYKKSSKKSLKNMSDDELKKAVDRISKENRLKKLSSTKDEKRSYRSRGDMTDEELNAQVDRLQLEANFRKEALKSNKAAVDKVNTIMKMATNEALKDLDKQKFSESKRADWAIKQAIKGSTKKIRDGKTISTK